MLSEIQYRMLKLIYVYGDMPPDAESTLRIQGAVFDKVEYALERRGYINNRQATSAGEAAIAAYKHRQREIFEQKAVLNNVHLGGCRHA